MKFNKWLFAVFVIGIMLFAITANVSAQSDNELGNEDDEGEEFEDGNGESQDDESISDIEDQKDFEQENEVEVEVEDEAEVELEVDDEDVLITKYNYGMEVRLLQLQKSILNHINKGKLIITEINNQGFDVDTKSLESHVENMVLLNDEISDALLQEPVIVTVEEFVSMKYDATKLTYQFKAELYDLLTPEQLKLIKDALKDDFEKKDANELKIENKFKEKVREYNKEVSMKMFEKFGGENEQLKSMIETGALDSKLLKEKLREEYKNLGEARKNQLKLSIKEEKSIDSKARLELDAKVKGLNSDEVLKIVKDDSLTQEEKQAKIRILAQEHRAENPTCYNQVLDAQETGIDCGGNCPACFKSENGRKIRDNNEKGSAGKESRR